MPPFFRGAAAEPSKLKAALSSAIGGCRTAPVESYPPQTRRPPASNTSRTYSRADGYLLHRNTGVKVATAAGYRVSAGLVGKSAGTAPVTSKSRVLAVSAGRKETA